MDDDIEKYLNSLPVNRGEKLKKIREIIFSLYPSTVESRNEKILNYKLNGTTLCYLASQKQYVSLYMSTKLVADNKKILSKFNCGKSCIRFRSKIPYDLVENLLKQADNYFDK